MTIWSSPPKTNEPPAPRIEAPRLSRLYDPAQGAEYVIIAHPTLEASATEYARYRDTATVSPVSVKLVYIDQIYDEYGYGSLTPWAIKRFANHGLQFRNALAVTPQCGPARAAWTGVRPSN